MDNVIRTNIKIEGISIRDLSNNAYLIYHNLKHDKDIYADMPSVSKFFFGMPEPVIRSSYIQSNIRTNEEKKRYVHLQGVEDISVLLKHSARKIYILCPGYNSPLPEDGQIFMPAVFGHLYDALPEGVKLVGATKLKWGEDPYQELKNELSGYDVHFLTSKIPI